jgi:hypothetical protein
MDSTFHIQSDLSDVQTQTLLLLFSAPSPVVALSTANSSDKTRAATTKLKSMGLVADTTDGLIVTDTGVEMLDRINVVDKMGERTPYGEEEFEKAIKLTSAPAAQFECTWPLISSISQHV